MMRVKKKKSRFVPSIIFKVAAGGGTLVPLCCATGAMSALEVACVAVTAFATVACVAFDGGLCGVRDDSGSDASDAGHGDARFGVADIGFTVADVGFSDAELKDGPLGVALDAFHSG
jgi:hypothetical protein